MESKSENLVSINGMNLFHPISVLLEKLEPFPSTLSECSNPSVFENGFACATIILIAASLESGINRTRFLLHIDPDRGKWSFLRKFCRQNKVFTKLQELYVVRDAIVHNHIWEERFTLTPDFRPRWDVLQKLIGGDQKLDDVLDLQNHRTKLLHMNVVPTHICKSDLQIVLGVALEFLYFLERTDREYFYFSPQPVWYKGKAILFSKLLDSYSRHGSYIEETDNDIGERVP